jgi:hypothetical protein
MEYIRKFTLFNLAMFCFLIQTCYSNHLNCSNVTQSIPYENVSTSLNTTTIKVFNSTTNKTVSINTTTAINTTTIIYVNVTTLNCTLHDWGEGIYSDTDVGNWKLLVVILLAMSVFLMFLICYVKLSKIYKNSKTKLYSGSYSTTDQEPPAHPDGHLDPSDSSDISMRDTHSHIHNTTPANSVGDDNRTIIVPAPSTQTGGNTDKSAYTMGGHKTASLSLLKHVDGEQESDPLANNSSENS